MCLSVRWHIGSYLSPFESCVSSIDSNSHVKVCSSTGDMVSPLEPLNSDMRRGTKGAGFLFLEPQRLKVNNHFCYIRSVSVMKRKFLTIA
jgi:hypothetical protein